MTGALTFVVCAYKESPFLDAAVASLRAQTLPCEILISTSTPNAHIAGVAEKYGVPVRVNPDGGSSPKDWNFAYAQAETDFVTLAHQDDHYEPGFAESTMRRIAAGNAPLLAFTDYYEIRYKVRGGEGERVDHNGLLRVKRAMLLPIRLFPGSRWVRRRVLSFGYPMNCPGSTYNRRRFPDFRFRTDWHNSHDWDAAARLADERGDFLYVPGRLLGHRIYTESQTTNTIGSGQRAGEDLDMFRRYWPEGIARAIMKQYARAYASNEL